MNRRAFILAVFGGAAAVELGSAADLAVPHRMPAPEPVPQFPAPGKWLQPYSYAFQSRFMGSKPCISKLAVDRNFLLHSVSWSAPWPGMEVELLQDDKMLCKAYYRPGCDRLVLVVPIFMPTGTSFVLQVQNVAETGDENHSLIVLNGTREMTEEDLARYRSCAIDAEFTEEEDHE